MSANEVEIPITQYFETDVTFLGLKVPKVGFSVVNKSNELLDSKHETKLPGTAGWILVKLAYEEFSKKYSAAVFEKFHCHLDIDKLLFSQLSVYHYSEVKPVITN